MKKLKQVILMSLLILSVGANSLFAQTVPSEKCLEAINSQSVSASKGSFKIAKDIKVVLNGQEVTLSEPVLIDEGSTLLPIRAIGNLLGSKVIYNKAYKVATIINGDRVVEVPLGYSFGIINGEKTAIPNGKCAVTYKGITYLPVRFVSEALGITIQYVPEKKAIEIVTDGQTVAIAPQTTISYQFRKPAYLSEHFAKHGKEFGYASEKEYLEGANRVIQSKEALHKLEKEDGDDVYYLEASNEIVIVSTDGYIRTYFKPEGGIAYFNKQ